MKKYSAVELNAIDMKANHPEQTVHCPRCGKELIFEDFGSSYIVRCPTDGCLKEVCRGL